MYGTRELNAKRAELLKEYKGKYFTPQGQGKHPSTLYMIKGVIYNHATEVLNLTYVEVHVKTKFNSLVGEYKELVPQKDLHCISPRRLSGTMNIVTEKKDKFDIAYKAD